MGLGAQMTVWPDELCDGLAQKGFRVIRFDNRDTGLSSQLDEHGTPSLLKTWLSRRLPIQSNIPYQLEDMANDVLELLRALNIKRAHLVGASMGGMIAQILAANYKKKVVSLTSIMSTIAPPALSAPTVKVMLKLARRPRQSSREAAIRYTMRLNRLIGSPAYPVDDMTLRQQATANIERAYNPSGFKRQLAALTASGDRRHLAAKIKVPTLVIHGADDPIIPVVGGHTTARLIRKSKLRIVDGMGHNLPPALIDKMTKWIAKHAKRADRKRLAKKSAKKKARQPGA
ncbi:alpha/beta hydrolase [Alteromonas sp. SM 2104]|nr:alpha/beta hydrolase [Alteromonas oceanisediminis]